MPHSGVTQPNLVTQETDNVGINGSIKQRLMTTWPTWILFFLFCGVSVSAAHHPLRADRTFVLVSAFVSFHREAGRREAERGRGDSV